jgi:O-phospho-L-seryl-tRNASec:L-selenocysteinyl-tRNA synthase
VLSAHSERYLVTPNNKISIACTLTSLNESVFKPNNLSPTFFGSYLFSRRVSGVRVVAQSDKSKINDSVFSNYGSHCEDYP